MDDFGSVLLMSVNFEGDRAQTGGHYGFLQHFRRYQNAIRREGDSSKAMRLRVSEACSADHAHLSR
jgi:hypothetical protein